MSVGRVMTLGGEVVDGAGQKLAGEGRVAAARSEARRLPRDGVGDATTGERTRLGAPKPRIPGRGCCRMARASCGGSPGPPAARSRRTLSQEKEKVESCDAKVIDIDQ